MVEEEDGGNRRLRRRWEEEEGWAERIDTFLVRMLLRFDTDERCWRVVGWRSQEKLVLGFRWSPPRRRRRCWEEEEEEWAGVERERRTTTTRVVAAEEVTTCRLHRRSRKEVHR